MNSKIVLAACAAAASISFAGSANAAANLTSAAVTGPTGTVWDTTVNGFYTLFLQQPTLGAFINPNDEAINVATVAGENFAFLSGDGFPTNTTLNSDPFYTLTLGFADGASLTGQYFTATNTFVGGPSTTVGGTTYNLVEFSYERSLANPVSEYRAVRGGNGNDYAGNFRFDTSLVAGAVPEPATWAMMIFGFGVVGRSLRGRRRNATASFA